MKSNIEVAHEEDTDAILARAGAWLFDGDGTPRGTGGKRVQGLALDIPHGFHGDPLTVDPGTTDEARAGSPKGYARGFHALQNKKRSSQCLGWP